MITLLSTDGKDFYIINIIFVFLILKKCFMKYYFFLLKNIICIMKLY